MTTRSAFANHQYGHHEMMCDRNFQNGGGSLVGKTNTKNKQINKNNPLFTCCYSEGLCLTFV